jgi:hypothetical protein
MREPAVLHLAGDTAVAGLGEHPERDRPEIGITGKDVVGKGGGFGNGAAAEQGAE